MVLFKPAIREAHRLDGSEHSRRGGEASQTLNRAAGVVSARHVSIAFPRRGCRRRAAPIWLHEVKFDGYRAMIRRDGGGVRLFTRRGQTGQAFEVGSNAAPYRKGTRW